MTRLRMALLGLGGAGGALLARLRSDERVELVAVAERDRDLMRGVAGLDGVRFYEDYRSLIVEESRRTLDGLFVALEPFESVEFVEMAASLNLPVFHRPPFARTTAEGRRIIEAFAGHPSSLVVPNLWRFDGALESAIAPDSPWGRLRAVNVLLNTTDEATTWRGDSVRAGGGVLLNGAYDMVDLLIALGGLPELVHAECGQALPVGVPRIYDTEDFAAVTLRFGRDQVGTLTAWRGAARRTVGLSLLGSEGTMFLDDDGMVTIPRSGTEARHTARDGTNPLEAALQAFLAMKSGDVRANFPPATKHLKTLAVIEAAYLSAKTGAAESPRQFLE